MTDNATTRQCIITNKVDHTHGYIELDNGERIGRGWFSNAEWDILDISSSLEYTVNNKLCLVSIKEVTNEHN